MGHRVLFLKKSRGRTRGSHWPVVGHVIISCERVNGVD